MTQRVPFSSATSNRRRIFNLRCQKHTDTTCFSSFCEELDIWSVVVVVVVVVVVDLTGVEDEVSCIKFSVVTFCSLLHCFTDATLFPVALFH